MSESRVVFLEGHRVYMRPIEIADGPVLQRNANDPYVRSRISRQSPQSLHDEEEWIRSLSKRRDTDLTLGIVLKESDLLIGSMGIHNIKWIDRVGTTGALIGNSEHRGKGYGTEAKMLLLNHGFNTMNLRKICSTALATNEASLSFNSKCGYKEEGRLKNHVFVHGTYHDLVHTAVFKEDFLPLWEEYKEKYMK